MQDGAIFLMFNNQGSPRGETEVKAPNWWMGMARHAAGRGSLTLNLMLSLDPATVGEQGYSQIFQVGETFNGERAHRSSAPARLPDAGGGGVAAAAREGIRR